jgi:5-methylcytosine-specific restriction endonuclease McrA
VEYLGCSIGHYRAYIEATFGGGMTWDNYGEWEIDHIVPIRFPASDGGPPSLEDVITRLHYTNTQAMWANENKAKGNRWIGPNHDPDPALQLSEHEIDELLASLDVTV